MKKILSTLGILIILGIGFLITNTDLFDNFGKDKTETIQTSEADKALINIKYDEKKHPENYTYLNDNKVTLTDDDKQILKEKGQSKAWQSYSNLDSLGRGQKGTALVTKKSVVEHSSKYLKEHGLLYGDKKIYERPPFPSYVHVSGEYADGTFDSAKQRWKGQESNNGQTDLGSYKGWLYNKSHTIAWSLGGDMETHNVTPVSYTHL